MTTEAQKQFRQDGFVAVRSFLSAREVSDCLDQLNRFIADVVPTIPANHVFYEDKNDPSTLKQLQRMHEHDRWFSDFFQDKPRHLAQELLGSDVTGQNLQFFNKPPGVGQPTPPHQDGFYFKLDPPEALTMWMALEDVDEGERMCALHPRFTLEWDAPTWANGNAGFFTGNHRLREHRR